MRTFFPSESGKESQLNALNPPLLLYNWYDLFKKIKLEVNAMRKSKIKVLESLIKVPEPPILPFYKPVDYVKVLAQIHEELELCPPQEQSNLYLLQCQVFRGLGEVKLLRRSLRAAWQKANSIHEKLIFGAWLKYEKQGEEHISNLLASCDKCAQEFGPVDILTQLPIDATVSRTHENISMNGNEIPRNVSFRKQDEKVDCDRQKISSLSAPFHAMLNGCFSESLREDIDYVTGSLNEVPTHLLLEILVFANKFCCEKLKDACDRKLASFVSSREDAVELMAYALEENCPVLAASCLQVFLNDLPDCLNDNRVVEIFRHADRQQRSIMVGQASFSLFCLLSEVCMNLDPQLDKTACFLERLVEFSENDRQRMLAFHQLGCLRLLRKEYDEAKRLFEEALNAGHIYSVAGLARLSYIKGHKLWSCEKLSSVICTVTPLGWMYQERSLYCEGDKRWEDLEKASELDPTLTYPYMFRAATLMRNQNVQAALAEINRVLGFKHALECLELRFCFYLALEDYKSAICDVQAILTLSPDYRMFEGRVAASSGGSRISRSGHVENWTTADCWLQLYDRWSSVDDIGSLSVIYQILESDEQKVLNCPEAAMLSLQLARQHASSDDEKLVYEAWILYDTGHCEEGLRKADESIKIKRSLEAFFLKAYALTDSSQNPSSSSTVVSLLEDALKCPSGRLRKGQVSICQVNFLFYPYLN
ncbi:ETO1-like protein 1 [Pyrus ussuriensis x Pyrus communis]|uniref:ETO1-like protein 1 n=1 Tax=Pyrus ussuriensis x Pyrus communis TaxID=2448454 RepID=A0A5N5GLV8_9ROSA|nr:ETO1-like protein 1 [Pyrus ussuriensis x Pyrus communis]